MDAIFVQSQVFVYYLSIFISIFRLQQSEWKYSLIKQIKEF